MLYFPSPDSDIHYSQPTTIFNFTDPISSLTVFQSRLYIASPKSLFRLNTPTSSPRRIRKPPTGLLLQLANANSQFFPPRKF